MMIMEIVDGVPTATASSHSFGRYAVSSHLGCEPQECSITLFQGAPIWCRDSEVDEIMAYFPGKEDLKKPLEERYKIAVEYLETIATTENSKTLALEALRHMGELK